MRSTSLMLFLSLALSISACNKPTEKAKPAVETKQPSVVENEAPQEEELEDEEAEEEVVEAEEPTSTKDLDEMDKGALEAACFRGSTAACDRLGH